MCGYECVRHEGIRIVYIMDSNTCIRHAHVALKNFCKREAKHEHNPHQSAGLPDCMHINECGTTAFALCILWIVTPAYATRIQRGCHLQAWARSMNTTRIKARVCPTVCT